MTDRTSDSAESPPGFEAAISEIEREYDCRVIAARDTGSRAWGLDGPESDYDVDFLFVQPAVAYATLGEYVASITTSHGEKLELAGWNVKRFAELLVESNPSAVEFLHSPLCYREHEALAALERDVAADFDPVALYHHYRSLASNQYRKYIRRVLLANDEPEWLIVGDDDAGYDVRRLDEDGDPDGAVTRVEKPTGLREATTDRSVKRNLYVGRAGLAARYVLATHEFPPLEFAALLDELAEISEIDTQWIETARDLAARKRAGHGGEIVGDPFGREIVPPTEIDYERHAGGGIDAERVNDFVRTTLDDY
jgi:hypothetical protein